MSRSWRERRNAGVSIPTTHQSTFDIMAKRAYSSMPTQGWIGDMPVSYSGPTALRREKCVMVAESQNSLTRKVIQS
jgi:hypothetical protein